jgi:3'(2'), 5'-bisphosphate nucleotidase
MHSDNKVQFIEEILKTAGDILIKFSKKDLKTKKSLDDNLKTNIDEILHDHIFNQLRKISNIDIISEEDDHHNAKKRPKQYFLIDPLDGTRSYVEGFSSYATQLALIENNSVLMSFIYLPTLDEYYSAYLGGGSFLNGDRLQECKIDMPLSITDNYKKPTNLISKLMEKSSIKNYIEAGSLAYKMCLVAKNEAQVFLKETRIADWDIAPAKLILEEMGGTVTLLNGQEYSLYGEFKKKNLLVTSNKKIEQYVLKMI